VTSRPKADARRDRAERERRFKAALDGYAVGRLTATEALIAAGMASRAVRLAYRFPRLFGGLSPLAAADRLRPVYAPVEGWRTSTSPGRSRLPSEQKPPDRPFR
jgi:hypothetical protein